MRKEQIKLIGFKTSRDAIKEFINKYTRWVPQVNHYSPINAIDLMEKIEWNLGEVRKRGKYKDCHEYIFNVKYTYGR